MERTDRGEYICEASNNVGPAVNMTANLVVRFGPKITVPRPRVQQAVGYDALLQCNVNSYPTSAIDWLKDGKIIEKKKILCCTFQHWGNFHPHNIESE